MVTCNLTFEPSLSSVSIALASSRCTCRTMYWLGLYALVPLAKTVIFVGLAVAGAMLVDRWVDGVLGVA